MRLHPPAQLRPGLHAAQHLPHRLAGEAPARQRRVGAGPGPRHRRRPGPAWRTGISELTCVIFREVLAFAREGIRELVAVVSLPVERIFRRLGLPIEAPGHRQAVDLGGRARVGIRFHLTSVSTGVVHRPVAIPAAGDARSPSSGASSPTTWGFKTFRLSGPFPTPCKTDWMASCESYFRATVTSHRAALETGPPWGGRPLALPLSSILLNSPSMGANADEDAGLQAAAGPGRG